LKAPDSVGKGEAYFTQRSCAAIDYCKAEEVLKSGSDAFGENLHEGRMEG
jgi:hypothetical protein